MPSKRATVRRVRGVLMAAIIWGFSVPSPAEQTNTEDLQKQVDALRAELQALRKDVAEMKDALARQGQRPLAVGATIDLGDRPLRGDASAAVTLVEFSDYQCPFCGNYVRGTYPAIEAAYIKTGKVRTVFFDNPLAAIHKSAFKAAEAAACGREQGKFWEMHDRLFDNQTSLEPWEAHASAVGLDVGQFQDCLASGRYDARIRGDLGEARRLGFTGTPAFVVGRTSSEDPGKLKIAAVLRGSAPFADFKAAIDPLLGAGPTTAPAK